MPTLPIISAYLFAYALHTYGHFLVTDAILQKHRRVPGKVLFLCYAAMYAIRAVAYFFIPLNLTLNLCLSFGLIFIITLFYRTSLLKRLLTTAFNFVLASIGEVIAAMLLSVVLGPSIATIVSETQLSVIGMVLSGIITFALMLLSVRIFRTKAGEQTELPKAYLAAAFSIPTISILVSYMLQVASLQGLPLTSTLACIISIALLGTNVLVFYLYKKLRKEVKAENLSKMFGRTPAGLCLLEADENLTILEANGIFYAIIDNSPDEAANDGPATLASLLDKTAWDSLKIIRAEILSANMCAGETEISIHTRNHGKRTILAKFYKDKTENNITLNVIDITQRKHTEELLRLSEERYRLALTQSGKMFFSLDVPTNTMQLSFEQAQKFELPTRVEHMPDNPMLLRMIEPESIKAYRNFYESILAGQKNGEVLLSCHTKEDAENILWYHIAFTSIFDENGTPSSAIITYEDISEQHLAELSARWKSLEVMLAQDHDYAMAVFDLNRGRLVTWNGGDIGALPGGLVSYDEINRYISGRYIYEKDRDAILRFLDADGLKTLYAEGQAEASMECRVRRNGRFEWAKFIAQLIADPYNGHILARIFLVDIEKEKSGILEMERNVEELKKELENSRIKVMINQMQPHFLYNALSSIQMITKRDPDKAYGLLRDFTIHLRSSIKALSSDAPIPFTEELANVRAYLNIEMMRYAGRLHVEYDIRCEDFTVIPLTIQPLVENAVKHGIFPKGKAGGAVALRSYEADGATVVEVEDDGMGFDVAQAMEENNDSYGLKNLVFRLKSLMNATVVFQSNPGEGTFVTVTIPQGGMKGGGTDEDNRS